MSDHSITRRTLLGASATVMSILDQKPAASALAAVPFHLGTITYNVAKDWDLPTLIHHTKAAGLEGVELRTTHKHGVEIALAPEARKEVRQRFSDAGLTLWGLGTVCEFQSADPAILNKNIDECKQWCELAKSVGARGVKVRPNGIPRDASLPNTLDQIGKSLAKVASTARDNGVEIWLEVHGPTTMNPPNIRKILDICATRDVVGACWNSNATDVINGSVRQNFDLLAKDIKSCHINNLWDASYPYRELFSLFRGIGYRGFTLCEVGTALPAEAGIAFLQCYRGLWQELNRA